MSDLDDKKSRQTTPRRRFSPLALAALASALTTSMASVPVWASPPETIWVEDLTLHPAGPAELLVQYDFLDPALDAEMDATDILILRTSSGFDRAPMDWSPSFGVTQTGTGSARLLHVGLRARYRLLGSQGDARMGLVFNYAAMLAGVRAHRFEQRLAGRWRVGSMRLGWDIGLAEQFGENIDVEARASASLSWGMVMEYLHVGVESFALVPLVGDRLTDFAIGRASDGFALYAGPTMRFHFEYLWLAAGAATGAMVGDGAPVLVRVQLGTLF